MKRHFLPIVAFLLLSACTEVEDFGDYWGKGFVDPALAGTWKKIGVPGRKLNDTPGADRLLFVKNRMSYSLQESNPVDRTLPDDVAAQRNKDNDERIAVRTLKIGSHLFFMERSEEGKQGGMIDRYEIKGNILRQYVLNNGPSLGLVGNETSNREEHQEKHGRRTLRRHQDL
jgi:hypothetical protein